jgi:hypothetical protein
MKLVKFLLAIVMVALIANRASAVSFVGTTTQFSKLTINFVVGTNGVITTNGSYTIEKLGKTPTINNKTLMIWFANWSGNNVTNWFVAGAQWIFDWNTYEAAIADKTGTNIIFYAGSSDGVHSGGITAYLDIDWFNKLGPSNLTQSNVNPGSETFSINFDLGHFHLYHNDNSDSTTFDDLTANGPKSSQYYDHWDSGHNYISWTDSETLNFQGSGVTFNNEDFSAVGGQVTASGSGTGHNLYIYNNFLQ